MRQYYVTALVLVAVAMAAFSANPAEYFNAKSLFFRDEGGLPSAVGPSAPLPVSDAQFGTADYDHYITVGTSAVATFGTSIPVSAGARVRVQATGTVYFSNVGKAVASMSSLSYIRADVPEFFVLADGVSPQFLAATASVLRIRVENP